MFVNHLSLASGSPHHQLSAAAAAAAAGDVKACNNASHSLSGRQWRQRASQRYLHGASWLTTRVDMPTSSLAFILRRHMASMDLNSRSITASLMVRSTTFKAYCTVYFVWTCYDTRVTGVSVDYTSCYSLSVQQANTQVWCGRDSPNEALTMLPLSLWSFCSFIVFLVFLSLIAPCDHIVTSLQWLPRNRRKNEIIEEQKKRYTRKEGVLSADLLWLPLQHIYLSSSSVEISVHGGVSLNLKKCATHHNMLTWHPVITIKVFPNLKKHLREQRFSTEDELKYAIEEWLWSGIQTITILF